jgi:Txe/YoeB family toxin of Txe-Axe toxin-antitoxin module
MNSKDIFVVFANPKIELEFDKLKQGKFEDKKLYEYISRAIEDLKKDPTSGVKIPKNVWPKEYIQKFEITNLWKYDLPNAWRLIYTIKTDDIQILNVILEWFDHKNYEKKFKY